MKLFFSTTLLAAFASQAFAAPKRSNTNDLQNIASNSLAFAEGNNPLNVESMNKIQQKVNKLVNTVQGEAKNYGVDLKRKFSNSDSTNMSSYTVQHTLESNIDNLELKLKHFRKEPTTNQPSTNQPKTILLTIHGYGDASAYYSDLAEYLSSNHDIDVITFDQRMHGENKNEIPYFTNLDDFEADIIQILEFLRTKYPETKIFIYGHSMGGGILAQMCLRQTKKIEDLNISGFIFESPFLQLHPSTGKWWMLLLIRFLNSISPSLVLPDELNLDFIANNEVIKNRMKLDNTRTKYSRAATAKTFVNLQEYFDLNTRFWNKKFKASIHIPDSDQICDRKAIDKWYDFIKNVEGNEKIEYKGAGHDLKADFDPKLFFENVARFVNNLK